MGRHFRTSLGLDAVFAIVDVVGCQCSLFLGRLRLLVSNLTCPKASSASIRGERHVSSHIFTVYRSPNLWPQVAGFLKTAEDARTVEEAFKASSQTSNSTTASGQPWSCLKSMRLEDLHKFQNESKAVEDAIKHFPNNVYLKDH